MRKAFLLPLLAFAGLSFAYLSSPQKWSVKSDESVVRFRLPEEGTSGAITGLTADIAFDPREPENSSIKASVEVKTLFTGNDKKDNHLKASDFFDAEKYPLITFTSASIRKDSAAAFVATGTLTIRDSSKTIDIPFQFNRKKKKKDAVFTGNFSIFSGDFGVGKKSKTGKDKVMVEISVPVKAL